jgi:hypothetical protein
MSGCARRCCGVEMGLAADRRRDVHVVKLRLLSEHDGLDGKGASPLDLRPSLLLSAVSRNVGRETGM